MEHPGRFVPYLVVGAAVAAALAVAGFPVTALAPLVFALACPLMMVLMMGGMAGMHSRGKDHTGHGCEHDPRRGSEPIPPPR